MMKSIRCRNKMLVIMVIVLLLLSSSTTIFSYGGVPIERIHKFSSTIPLNDTSYTTDKNTINLSGYAYDPVAENDFKLVREHFTKY